MPPEMPPKAMSAVPDYLKKSVDNAKGLPPGHIFNLYAPMWVSKDFQSEQGGKKEIKWEIAESIDKKEGKWDSATKSKQLLRQDRKSGKAGTLNLTAENFPKEVVKFQENLINRQVSLAQKVGAFVLPCQLTAPLATGLGNEHPVENGFSFLSPYGLPYIAGSGIKGSLRHAAELMALFGEEYDIKDFCMLDVWWLFGFEGYGASYWACSIRRRKDNEDDASYEKYLDTMQPYIKAMKGQRIKLESRSDFKQFLEKYKLDASIVEGKKAVVEKISLKGALGFWDAFPACNKMAVEILTPHYSHYYQNGDSPHDSGQPIPSSFLVVPQGCNLNLIIECDKNRLPEESYDWQKLCTKIIEFASKWQGFGGKTAVGYGAFKYDEKLLKEREAAKEEAEKKAAEEARLNSMSETSRKIEEFSKILNAEITRRPTYIINESKINAELKGFFAICESLTVKEEKDLALEVLNKLFAYVKANDKKKKEVRSEIEKLSQK